MWYNYTMDIIITNNILVKTNCAGEYRIEYSEEWLNVRDVLVCVRDYIHKGHCLLTHPLSGSVKPNETPYKSVLISGEPQKSAATIKNVKTDAQSLQIIENSIMKLGSFTQKNIPEHCLPDLREIDFALISSAIK